MAEQDTLVEQPTSDDVTKTPEGLTKEGDDLYKNRKFKDAAEKYQEAVDKGSGDAMYKLANMIYNNQISGDGYTFRYAISLYGMARNAGYHVDEKKLQKILGHYHRYRHNSVNINIPTTRIGGYKKRKSNRARTRARARKHKHKWSLKYKRSIDCKHPKGFSQRQHCKYGRKTMRKLSRKK
jgi:hypothetical protein